jgi:hypothetical protein
LWAITAAQNPMGADWWPQVYCRLLAMDVKKALASFIPPPAIPKWLFGIPIRQTISPPPISPSFFHLNWGQLLIQRIIN